MTEQELDSNKNFCEGFMYCALESCGLHNEFDYEVVMNGVGVEKVILTRRKIRQEDEPLILVDNFLSLSKLIDKTLYKEFYESGIYFDTESGKFIIR